MTRNMGLRLGFAYNCEFILMWIIYRNDYSEVGIFIEYLFQKYSYTTIQRAPGRQTSPPSYLSASH